MPSRVQNMLAKTTALTLPRALLIAGIGLVIWSFVFVVTEPEGWHFILLMAPLALGPVLLAGAAIWGVLAGLRRLFLGVGNS